MNMRNIALWAVIAALLIALFSYLQPTDTAERGTQISYSELLERARNGEVRSVDVDGYTVHGVTITDQRFTTRAYSQDHLVEQMDAAGVNISYEEPGGGFNIWDLVGSILPLIIIVGLWFFLMRQMQGGGGRGAMSFGKSKARLLTERHGRVTFDDVAGIDEAKEELQEIVEFLKDPSKFQRLGGKIPKGALLVGPPGTGKTLTARAVAGEANVPFFTISGSDFVEMFVGVGASRVRDMFEQAKKNAPCIIFIDEIDAVGRSRGAGIGGGNDEREQTLNQLLVEMDGFEANEGIIIIAATNRPDVLDPALLRPGRFDRQITVGNPDIIGREKILKVHMRNVPTAKDVNAKVIARGTPGFSGADIANLVNEAALLAARRGKRMVSMKEFEDAKDKVMMGPERRSMVMSDKEKRLTAYHEAGHAIVGLKMPATDPVHKATIIPRGRALGMVMQLPTDDKLSQTRQEMTSRLAVLMGGRVAEEIAFGEENVTSGASSDIKMATRIARAMVTQFGLSDEVGPIDYGESDDPYRPTQISQETSKKIEEQVRHLVQTGMDEARRIMTDYKDDWVAIAEGLLEYETLTGDEINDLLNGKKPERPEDEDDMPGPSSAVPITGSRKKKDGDGGVGDGSPEPA
ncbi:ATP-dependent zinc metalloprotease FtsH [Ponticaulis sp.]|jgi:cell division protease FtsH|uniref:ATP-dependent zinc metalloprotease FtsH n=1 Tax=Ponticaulis TaxID=1123044 RepID=UPI0003B5D047|nr:ATP-dependent zinc metalloprotease FtsH [Ponticaulis sp.]MAF58830.1 cell division protein FtsH [Ponticaulis sp.]MBN02771.1 cell division protein FtsH [Ponticaulis sp.]